MKKTDDAVTEQVRVLINDAMEKVQKEYKTDVVGFGKRLQIQHPQQWKRDWKEDWDWKFSQAEITYDIQVKVSEYGSTSRR